MPSNCPQSFQQYHTPMAMGFGMYGMNMQSSYAPMLDSGKGKGKASDADFEAAFAEYSKSVEKPVGAKIEELKEGETLETLGNALKEVKLDDTKEAEKDFTLGDDFQKYVYKPAFLIMHNYRN